MKRGKWYSILVAGLVLSLASSVLACGQPNDREGQEIINYLESIMPIMEANDAWLDEYNDLQRIKNIDLKEYEIQMLDLTLRLNEIYHDLYSTTPPPVLRDFKHKFCKECELRIEAQKLVSRAFLETNPQLLLEADELIWEANAVRSEWGEQLIDLFDKYNIKY